MTKDDKLSLMRKIASETRRWAKRSRKHFDDDLCGMCAIASARLHANITAQGLSAVIAIRNKIDDGHCFVIAYGHVIDITATQFGLKPVEIRPLSVAVKYSFWRKTKIVKDSKELVVFQKKAGWPLDQQAKI